MSLLSRRFPTILGLLLLVAGAAGYFYYMQINSPKSIPEVIPKKVRITNISDNKFSVSWTTEASTMGSVEYGVVGEKLTSIGKDERDTTNEGQYFTHHITIEGLQPSTQYGFRILSGIPPTRFDDNGSPYTATTGPVIGATPTSQNFYGKVELASKEPVDGAIAYLTLPGSATASTLVHDSGNYAFTLSTMRSSDARSYVEFDPSATIASLTIESGKQQSVSAVSLTNSAPTPTITLGQNMDFLNQTQIPLVAEIQPTASPSSYVAEKPSIFNVEPIGQAAVNAVTTSTVTIINPKEEGEILKTLKPEFRGTGPIGTTLSIALTGQKAISDTVLIAADGTWSWSPVIDLKIGKQLITVSSVTTSGTTQKVERGFTISTSTTGLDPAFVSSPSASTTTTSPTVSPVASSAATSSATPRITMPNTDDGVPTTGVIENTLLTGAMGIVIMVIGAVLLAL